MLNNRTERRAFLMVLKSEPCLDCKQIFPWYCMDFDHVPERGPKLFEINQNNIAHKKIEEVWKEISKCDVVCSNCHRKRTHLRKYPGKRSGPYKNTCKFGHDLTDPNNQYLLNGKRKGCLECRRVNVNAKYHGESHLPFDEKESLYQARVFTKRKEIINVYT